MLKYGHGWWWWITWLGPSSRCQNGSVSFQSGTSDPKSNCFIFIRLVGKTVVVLCTYLSNICDLCCSFSTYRGISQEVGRVQHINFRFLLIGDGKNLWHSLMSLFDQRLVSFSTCAFDVYRITVLWKLTSSPVLTRYRKPTWKMASRRTSSSAFLVDGFFKRPISTIGMDENEVDIVVSGQTVDQVRDCFRRLGWDGVRWFILIFKPI